ncbi:hypothetical protein ACQ4PT_036801 [Festuca glaucescens]
MDNYMAVAGAGLEGGAGAGAVAAGDGSVGGAGAVAAGAGSVSGAGAGAAGAGLVGSAGAVAAAGGDGAPTTAQMAAIYAEIDALYEPQQEVVPCEYETDDDVDEDNFESYVQRQLKRFHARELNIMKRGKYVCPFCPCKVRDGELASLEMHAMDTRHSARERQGKADHEALGRFVMGRRMPCSARIPKRNM